MAFKELGGARKKEFNAGTFEEMAALSKQHAMKICQKNNEPNRQGMSKMQTLLKDPAAMNDWLEEKQKQFESLPDS